MTAVNTGNSAAGWKNALRVVGWICLSAAVIVPFLALLLWDLQTAANVAQLASIPLILAGLLGVNLRAPHPPATAPGTPSDTAHVLPTGSTSVGGPPTPSYDLSRQPQNKPERRLKSEILSATIGAIATIVAAIITVFSRSSGDQPATLAPTSSGPVVHIIEPTKREEKEVGREAGAEVTGTASNLGEKSLWLFNLSGIPGGRSAYYLKSNRVPVVNGEWSAQDRPIGGPGGQQQEVTIIAVIADKNCEIMINALLAKPGDDRYFQDDLPTGCEGQDSVRVKKVRP
jgi:hypothetical protein